MFHEDQEKYYYFTSKQRLDTAVHTLHGLLQGIAADNKVTDAEMRKLIDWVAAHQEFSDRHPFNEIIPRIQEVLMDGIVDEEECADLLWLCNKFQTDSHFYDEVTADMQILHGLLGGILADGIVSEQELRALSDWINDHSHLRSCWPYDEIESVITEVMKDGKIDDQEQAALKEFFGEFSRSPGHKSVGRLGDEVTLSGICAVCPEIEFEGKLFCLTGTSERGPRDHVVSELVQRGARFNKGMRNDTDYLIVGAKGNPCWVYACYGRKVEDAVERRKGGQKILIVHEFDLWDAIEEPS